MTGKGRQQAGKRVLGAARLSRSTDESTSIERQKEQITLTCRARDLTLVHMAEDTDTSGAVSPFARDDLGDWLRNHVDEFDVIMVAKLDRLTRSLLDFADLIKWCNKNGKTIVSVAESIDLGSPAGRLLANILCLFAQFERERIGERRSEAYHKLAGMGKWNGGAAVPWGYKPVKAGDHWDLIPDPDVLPVVLSTVEAVVEGQSINVLAKALGVDRKGLTLRLRSRSLTGHVEIWRPPADGEEYTRWRKEKDKETGESVTLVPDVVRDSDGMPVRREALITDEKFEALQKALDGRKIVRVNRFDSPLLFHVVQCSHCGAVLYGNQQNRSNGTAYRYYRHQDHTTRPNTCTVRGQVNMPALDASFTAELLSRYGSRPVLAEIEHPAQDHTAELARVNEAIGEWEEKAIGGESAGSVLRILDGLHVKRSRLADLPQSEAWTEYVDTGRDLGDEWETWSTAERNAYLRGMQVRVLCAKGTEPVYDWGLFEGSKITWGDLLRSAEGASAVMT